MVPGGASAGLGTRADGTRTILVIQLRKMVIDLFVRIFYPDNYLLIEAIFTEILKSNYVTISRGKPAWVSATGGFLSMPNFVIYL